MNWFAEELHKQRSAKGISLNEIASITRINIQFLEALEQGNFSVLPQTYVRAFLREYAKCVGMDPNEIIKQYETQLARVNDTAHQPEQIQNESTGKTDLEKHSWWNIGRLSIGAALVIVAAILFYLAFFQPSSMDSVKQIPFREVVKESERVAFSKSNVKSSDSSRQPSATQSKNDSLFLVGLTIDKVWLSMIVDGKRTEEYLLLPNTKYVWAAKEKFTLTIGNAGGISFKLNGLPLEPFGKTGTVARNVTLTRESIPSHSGNRR